LKCAESGDNQSGYCNQSVIPGQIDEGEVPLFPEIHGSPKPQEHKNKQAEPVHKGVSTISMVGHVILTIRAKQ